MVGGTMAHGQGQTILSLSMLGPTETFRLPWGWRVVFGLLAFSGPAGYVAVQISVDLHERTIPVELRSHWSPIVIIICAVAAVAFFGDTLRPDLIIVSGEGIVYHRLWRIRWDDVVGARERSLLGAPYLQVQRRKGVPISLPLYYVGERPLRDVLRERAPDGNPIRTCLSAEGTRS
jgi:hypothetical protein